MEKYIGRPPMEKNGGVVAIDLAGNPIAHYYDPGLALVTSAMKIGNHFLLSLHSSPQPETISCPGRHMSQILEKIRPLQKNQSLSSTTMDESKNPDSSSLPRPSEATITNKKAHALCFFCHSIVPVVAATLLYQLDSFDPAPLPPSELTRHVITVPTQNDHMLRVSEFVGVGNLIGPEDIAYDAKSGVIYTGCADGWISRVTVNESAADSVVEKWVNTGGRPLGIGFGHNNELIVADPEKGLLNVTADGLVELLTDEADGQKFKTTDAVDVAHNGMIFYRCFI
ncbi:protein strictosidine synthase-like 5 [Quercus suber]|uniref:Protein strictosidine synthase-like 5 n=1 Tax=Quercus suber TaxID=58331 RepID=A0AAW0IDN0_QUESU